MNNAILLQQAFSTGPDAQWGAENNLFADMARLTYQRHAAYCMAHNFDYWHIIGDIHPEMTRGAWPKVWMLKWALEAGYEHIAWIDADAAVWDMECDLRDALPDGALIGAVEHWAEWFPQYGIEKHLNSGVLYLKNDARTLAFVADWLSRYPGHQRWLEQGAFNDMTKEERYAPICAALPAEWNATVNVNMVARPKVYGWHGVMPHARRLGMMKEAMKEDFLRFRLV